MLEYAAELVIQFGACHILPKCVLIGIESFLVTLLKFGYDLVLGLSGCCSIKLNVSVGGLCTHHVSTSAETAVLHHLELSD